ncbi:DUF3892 domain-containing protein [Colwelliaceae bacterium 6441]
MFTRTPRKVIDAKADNKGNITAVKIEGNKKFTSVKIALKMAEKKKIDLVVVNQPNGSKYIRTKPDRFKDNNLDNMAGDS